MNILYGVSGVGLGHLSRARLIARYLINKGHKIKILTYGQSFDDLNKEFDVLKINGMDISFQNGRIKRTKTIFSNIKNLFKFIIDFPQINSMIREFCPDVCITDMELFTTIISKVYFIPLISIDNENILKNMSLWSIEKHRIDFLLSKLVVKIFAFRADYYIILSLLKPEIARKRIFFVPPLIRTEVMGLSPKKSKIILVYLSRENSKVLEVLKNIPKKFLIYGYNIRKNEKNLEFKESSTFLEDLKNCSMIIANSGFSLISEAVYLKKPYLAIPIKEHFEQYLNSTMIKKIGFGNYYENFSINDFNDFIKNIHKYELLFKRNYYNFEKLFSVLDSILDKKNVKRRIFIGI